jgi:nucleoside-diphosphate-sugar epimerase
MESIIFGGRGFIGTHLDKNMKESIIYDLKDSHKNDIRYEIQIELEKSPFKKIFNLAAVHKTPGHQNHEYFETNIKGAENVCEFARENKINTIVFTSSIAPYGASEYLKTEESLPMPNTPYGISKLVAEEIHKRWQAEDPQNRKLIIVRPGVVFGKGEGGNFTRLYQSLKKHMFFYPGRKDTRKAAIYVKDLVRLMIEMVEKEAPGVHLFNMCYPEPHTIEEIVHTISRVTGVSANIPLIPGWALKTAAAGVYGSGRLFGKKIMGIHPDRVKKLMISTNISGKKLQDAGYQLNYSLEEAIADWYNDNECRELI